MVTLINISVGWRIPFGAHLAVQTATLALLMCSAVHPYCNSVVSWSGWGGVERQRTSGHSCSPSLAPACSLTITSQ